ncbi:MAG: dTDP-4-dehydrorhamnose reductase [Thiotrichaceae bacterium]|nr:dTDP-4-dehydrorhamnose reductase [Thiotrichaceae bacterium]PCI10353.1 MAG: dTDP-4-dehydrorhamnose reductase [Thiotrichales bacterium]
MSPAKPRILLSGTNGQVGSALQCLLSKNNEVFAFERATLDLTNSEQIRQHVQEIKPDIIVNAAAYTAVDQAEKEPALAFAINGTAPGIFAEEAAHINAILIHYSTDYVFDGSGNQPWQEEDKPAPLNIYGASKLAGEQTIKASGATHLILRTSWVYGEHGNNFVKTILRLAAEKEALNIIDDQIGAPTSAEFIADATAQILNQLKENSIALKSGTYHLCCSGETSWHGFSSEIVRLAKQHNTPLAVKEINSIPTSDYPTPAERPKNSRLDCTRLEKTFGLQPISWQAALANTLPLIIASSAEASASAK